MKGISFLFFLLIISCSLTGCVSDTKYNDALNKIANLEKELNDLKQGPQMSIIEIREQYESKNYDKVMELATTLHSKFNGVPEDIEARTMVRQIQDMRDKEAKKAEEEKTNLLAEQAKSAKEKARSIMRISKIHPSKPNSAGGVDLEIEWANNSDKVIKYVVFSVEPYNAVNDIVVSQIGGNSLFKGKITGPVSKDDVGLKNSYWENAWYNNSINTVQLVNVTIQYLDDTIVTLKDEDVQYIQF
ncbi:hypothetical protein ACYEXS_35745 [Paenibacillus sp. MAH-36]|uniref:DUF5780 domain-containing protein n=1 Tax=Paenibacillus violae TaxID=3077234 RepID=A0ABU3RKS5_9BACL|nr:hypothetical protein [Paenibacillus sp. PFR10]MDU0204902.1 hypothetical protein [Paenibacillus sp. PFR10]